MGRKARFTIDNGCYHVMQRGANRKKLFKEDADYERFMQILTTKKTPEIKIYHFCLMPNHVHLILKADTGKNLGEFMKKVSVSYAGYFRRKYGGIGHLYQDRFLSVIIQNGLYLLECGRYIELNPVKAAIVNSPENYEWSSCKYYFGLNENVFVDYNPEYYGLSDYDNIRIKLYKEYINSGFFERRNEKRFFREGAYGSEVFKEGLVNLGMKPNWSHPGPQKKQK